MTGCPDEIARGRTPGQIAYEADVERVPLYPDGAPRRPWDELSALARASWERNPTPRAPWGGGR